MGFRQSSITASREQQYTSCETFQPLSSVPVNLRDNGNINALASRLILLTTMEVVRLASSTAKADVALQQLAEQFSDWRQSDVHPMPPAFPKRYGPTRSGSSRFCR